MSLMAINLSFWDRLFGKKIFVKHFSDDHSHFSHGFKASIKSNITIYLKDGDKYSNYQAKLIINRNGRQIHVDYYPHLIAEGLFLTPSMTLLPTDTYFIELKYKSKVEIIKSRIEHKHTVVKIQ